MTNDLPGLVRHVALLLVLGGAVTAAVGFALWLYDEQQAASSHSSAVIVLATLTALQLLYWFGLTYWADLVTRKPEPDPVVDEL